MLFFVLHKNNRTKLLDHQGSKYKVSVNFRHFTVKIGKEEEDEEGEEGKGGKNNTNNNNVTLYS